MRYKNGRNAGIEINDLPFRKTGGGIENFVEVGQLKGSTVDFYDLVSAHECLKSGLDAEFAPEGYAFAFSICSACFSELSVNLAPLIIRATSSVRSGPAILRTLVLVRSPARFFSIR